MDACCAHAVLWSRVTWKISTFAGVLVVGVTLQLAVIIVWSMFVDTARTPKSELYLHTFCVGKQ